jgi:predicted nucleic acid-binding protein
VIVVDASVLSVPLGDDGADGASARAALKDRTLAAPELIDLEVVSVLRRRVKAGLMTPARAELALTDLTELPMRRASHRPLLFRCWELRETVTPYDAAYIALAEFLGIALLSGDGRLARARGIRCAIEVVA